MPSSGGTTGTPVSGSGGAGTIVSDPLPYTLLSLARYAKIMGLTPPHFWQAAGATYFPVLGSCSDVWYQYSWQNDDQVSRYDLAITIQDAEREIASVLGYWPAPMWTSKEMHPYPRNYRRETFGNGRNVRGLFKSIEADYGRFIAAGRRAVSAVSTAVNVAYSDPDGDGFNELATVSAATSLTDACEIKVYHLGKSGQQEWEIRPARSKAISGGTFTATFDAWLFIDPDLQAVLDNQAEAINLENSSNYVAQVDIYREYTDFTQASAEFSWEPKPYNSLVTTFCTSCGGTGCVACENTTQTGCLHVRDVESGILVPTPATYDSDNAQWNGAAWTECREPETVKLWYYSGDIDEQYLRGASCEALSQYFAQAIAWLATARIERPICACNNAHTLAMELRKDMAFSDDNGSFIMSEEELANPFGTKKGEVMAWRRIRRLSEIIPGVATV